MAVEEIDLSSTDPVMAAGSFYELTVILFGPHPDVPQNSPPHFVNFKRLVIYRSIISMKALMARKLLFILTVICFHLDLAAAEYQVSGTKLYVSGFLQNTGKEKFEEALNSGKDIQEVVFKNCLGGQGGAAYYLVRIIQERKLNTRVSGQCHSACAIAFLAGKFRSPLDEMGQHMLLFHSARGADGPAPAEYNKGVLSLIIRLTDGKLTQPVIEKISASTKENDGVVFVRSNYKVFTRDRTYYCDGTQGRDIANCEKIIDADPIALGIFKVEK